MDLRKKKTLRAIREAFYALRQQKALEDITVTELTQKAEISKATFYLHYRDIFDLSEQLQQEVIQSIFSRIDDPMEILTAPARFMKSMIQALGPDADRIAPLFSGNQAAALPQNIEAHIKECVFTRDPRLKEDPRVQVFLSYHIQGGYYAYIENIHRLGERKVLQIIEQIQNPPPAP